MNKTKIFIAMPLLALILSGCQINWTNTSSTEVSSEILDGLPYETQVTTTNVNGIIPSSYSSDATYFDLDGVYYYGENILRNLENRDPSDKNGFVIRSSENLAYRKTGWIANLNSLHNIKSIEFAGGDTDCLPTIYLGQDFGNYPVEVNLSSTSYFIETGEYSFFKIVANENRETYFNALKISWISQPSMRINNPRTIVDIADASKTKVEQSISISSSSFTNNAYWQSLGYAPNLTVALNLADDRSLAGDRQEMDYIPSSATANPQNAEGIYYRLSTMNYGDNGNSFRINMIDGTEGPVIFKGGAYTNIEDIAAYITAFGDNPPNARFTKSNKSNALYNWGSIARINYDFYSNDNSPKKFNYETECYTHSQYFAKTPSPNNYWYHYFESDVGATNWNDEPYQRGAYENSLRPYNNGEQITRGALRFVWTYNWTNVEHGEILKGTIDESYERNVYYTTTHYNDFQQYLNYYGGWAQRVGNTELGNEWGQYVASNHIHSMPGVNLVTLADLCAKL